YDADTLIPTIIYDAPEMGKVPMLTASSKKGLFTSLGNVIGNVSIISNEKGINTMYLDEATTMEIQSDCQEAPLTETSFTTKFQMSRNNTAMIAF
ncbi:hypothetical protein ACI3PL_19930, partial [Lacticaseibacillus paracasei]